MAHPPAPAPRSDRCLIRIALEPKVRSGPALVWMILGPGYASSDPVTSYLCSAEIRGTRAPPT